MTTNFLLIYVFCTSCEPEIVLPLLITKTKNNTSFTICTKHVNHQIISHSNFGLFKESIDLSGIFLFISRYFVGNLGANKHFWQWVSLISLEFKICCWSSSCCCSDSHQKSYLRMTFHMNDPPDQLIQVFEENFWPYTHITNCTNLSKMGMKWSEWSSFIMHFFPITYYLS